MARLGRVRVFRTYLIWPQFLWKKYHSISQSVFYRTFVLSDSLGVACERDSKCSGIWPCFNCPVSEPHSYMFWGNSSFHESLLEIELLPLGKQNSSHLLSWIHPSQSHQAQARVCGLRATNQISFPRLWLGSQWRRKAVVQQQQRQHWVSRDGHSNGVVALKTFQRLSIVLRVKPQPL